MMLACLGQVASENSPDADDADCFGAAVQEATQLMLMMLFVLGHLPNESTPDADDYGCFGALVRESLGAPAKRKST